MAGPKSSSQWGGESIPTGAYPNCYSNYFCRVKNHVTAELTRPEITGTQILNTAAMFFAASCVAYEAQNVNPVCSNMASAIKQANRIVILPRSGSSRSSLSAVKIGSLVKRSVLALTTGPPILGGGCSG